MNGLDLLAAVALKNNEVIFEKEKRDEEAKRIFVGDILLKDNELEELEKKDKKTKKNKKQPYIMPLIIWIMMW
jgi:hypothetical protein